MQKVKLNIVPKGVKKTTYLSQNDNGRVVRYELFNELVPYTLDGSETITLKVVRPDGEEILVSIENTFEGEAYIDVNFTDVMSAITGVGAGEIKITDGETELGSHNFDINVESDAYNGKDVVIETETGTLLSFNTEVEDNALEYESEIPYNAEGYTGLRVINTRTAPVYDKTPYLFRKTPDGSGNSCIEKLNGLTVAFNQKITNADFSDGTSGFSSTGGTITANNGVCSYTLTNIYENIYQNNLGSTPYEPIASHKYFISAYITLPHTPTGNRFNLYVGGAYIYFNPIANIKTLCQGIANAINNNRAQIHIAPFTADGWQVGDIVNIEKFIVIDLTQMFGSTIADYIYSLEQATAGAGVSFFKSLGFDKPYYEYNAGSLSSSKPVSKKVVGFNQFDEEMELGNIVNRSGEISDDNTRLRCKNFIPVIGGGTYYFFNGSNTEIDLFAYDKNKNFIGVYTYANGFVIGSNSASDVHNTFKTLPINCAYIKIKVTVTYGTTYNHDICINFSDPERNGQYEPYSEETYNLGGDELRGLLKLDSNNNIVAYGDTKTSDGNIERKFDIDTLFNTLDCNWNYQASYNYWFIDGADYIKILGAIGNISDSLPANVLTLNYPVVSRDWFNSNRENLPDKCIAFGASGVTYLRDTSITSTSYNGAKSTANAINMLFEKASETTESSTPFDNPQEVKITEEFIDGRAVEIPVGHDTIYGTDIEYQDIDFDTTIFGGNINAVDGVLSSEYNSDGSVKPTPEIIDITPTPIPVRAGDNVIFNSAEGNQTIRYYNQVE